MIDNFNHTEAQPFYNTISLSEIQWNIENEKSKGLQKVIETVFTENPKAEISGWLMKNYLEAKLNKRVNLNSVRRSISNLKNEGKLFKTPKMRMGEEGQPEHLYALNSPENAPEPETILPGKSILDFSKTLTQNKLFED